MKQIVEAQRDIRLRIAGIRVMVLEANLRGTKRKAVKNCRNMDITVLEANRRGTKRQAVKHRRKKGKGS